MCSDAVNRARFNGVSCIRMIKLGSIFLFLPLLGGCIVFPLVEVDRPEIVGTVQDNDGNPMPEARVSIIGSRTIKSMIEDYEVDSVKTDKNGEFIFKMKNRIDWVHGYKILARAPCHRRLKINAQGFIPQRIRVKHKGKYNKYSNNVCESVGFEFNIILKKQLTSQTTQATLGRRNKCGARV